MEDAAANTARRVSDLARIDSRCKKRGLAGVKPAGNYGISVAGADEDNIKRQKRNLAIATGRGRRTDTSNTIVVELTYGNDAQSGVRAHMGHIEAWLRYYDNYKNTSKAGMRGAAWCKALARIDGREKGGKHAIEIMRSALSGTEYHNRTSPKMQNHHSQQHCFQ